MNPTIYYDCGCGCGECGETIRKNDLEIATLRAEVERLTREREDYREKRANESENLRARVAELEAALRDLLAATYVADHAWDHGEYDARDRARAALSPGEGNK